MRNGNLLPKNNYMRILKLIGLLICFFLGFDTMTSAQTLFNYQTEGFEAAGSTSPTEPIVITTTTGTWTFMKAYSSSGSNNFCEGAKGLRLAGADAYAITPVLPNGANTITFKNGRKSKRTTTFYASTESDLSKIKDSDWIRLTAIESSVLGCDAGLYTVNIQNYTSIINPAAIQRIKIVNLSSDNDIDVLSITAASSESVISSDTEVLAFKLAGQIGNEITDYSAGTIKINVADGTNLNGIVPTTFTLSSGAAVSPSITTAQDFSNENPIIYTVTAQDGTTTKEWTVIVKSILSSEKEITAFKLSNDQIGNASINIATGQILITMPIGSNLSAITPLNFQISSSANANPAGSTSANFTTPVNYTLTAQDGSTKQWTVTVVLVDPNLTFTAYQAEQADFTGKVDAQHANFTGTGFIDFLVGGENQVTFTVCSQQAGAQTAKFRYSFAKDEDRSAALYVNDEFIQNLDFPRTATFTEWAEVITAVNLAAGVNKIKLTWELTDGPNLDKMDISGAQCPSFTLSVSGTNGGTVALNPVRANNSYFSGESVSLLAEEKPALKLDNWSGDLSGNTNPQSLVMNANRTVVANFRAINTYKINVTTVGIGGVTLSPAGGEYPEGTVVNITASSVLGSTFQGWSGNLSGINPTQTITVDGNKNITATFTDNLNIDFKKVVGFASVTADGFTGPTTGGDAVIPGRSKDIVYINGPAEFGKLCEILQQRIRYKTYSNNPLTIVLEPGIYTGAGGKESVWGNSMLTIQEQENLTIIGRRNVVFNFGINIKRSSNLIIRNITFQDYYDDGINIGETETHHVWIDHCTVGHPATRPANTEHPDGGIDVKNGASYVTISWTIYRNSWKTGLVGHSDNNGGTDAGRLKVTYFGNHFYNTNSRNPRVRFGEVHVLNNLEEQVGLYGIAASNNSSVYAEGNFFLNTRWPMYADRTSADFKAIYGNNSDDAFTSKTGNKPAMGLKQLNNEYDDSGLPVITSQINPLMLNPGGRSIKFDELNPEGIFTPSNYYQYDALPASVVRILVPIYAGADKIDWFPESLPLEIVSFKAKATDHLIKKVELNWTTVNEVNTEKFIIERRTAEEVHFQSIGSLSSKNVAGEHQYNFIDEDVSSGIFYYRLKQIDKDGKFEYSKIVTTEIKQTFALNVYPNPVSETLNVIHNVSGKSASVKVLGLEGKLFITANIKAGTNLTVIDVSKLHSGTYLVMSEIDGKKSILKFIKK